MYISRLKIYISSLEMNSSNGFGNFSGGIRSLFQRLRTFLPPYFRKMGNIIRNPDRPSTVLVPYLCKMKKHSF